MLNEKGQILPDEINNIIGELECLDYNLVSKVINSLVRDKIIWISFVPISGQVYFGVRLHSEVKKELSGLSIEVTSLENIEKPELVKEFFSKIRKVGATGIISGFWPKSGGLVWVIYDDDKDEQAVPHSMKELKILGIK